MRTDGTKIIDDFRRVCKVVQPDLNNNGNIMAMYKRNSFDDLFDTIGDLYHTLVAFHMPTKYLNIDITEDLVKIKMDCKCLKALFYADEEEDEE